MNEIKKNEEKEASLCPMSSLSHILWLQKYRERGNKSLNMFVYKIYGYFLIEISLKIVWKRNPYFMWNLSLRENPLWIFHFYNAHTISCISQKYLFAILFFFCWLKWIFQLTKHSLIVYYACDIKKRLVCMAKSISSLLESSSLCHLLTAAAKWINWCSNSDCRKV